MSTSMELKAYGPWAIVTGASSGLGEQFVRQLHQQGLNVVAVARRTERLQALADSLQSSHASVLPIAADLSQPEGLAQLYTATEALDIGLLICNAGFGLKGSHHEQSAAQLEQMVSLNAATPMLLTHHWIPRFLQRPCSAILLTGSVEGINPYPYSAAYSASKAFVHSLGAALYEELRPHGVHVLTLAPGAMDTEALTLQGFSAEQLPGVMSPADVAQQTLGRLSRGPLWIAGRSNRWSSWLLNKLPKRLALRLAGDGMLAAMKKNTPNG